MSARRFTLQPEPTFRKKVGIPVPGGKFEDIEFTLKYRDRLELKTFIEKHRPRDAAPADDDTPVDMPARVAEDVALILDMASGWDLADTFDVDSVGQLVRNYLTAPALIWDAYLSELSRLREKN